MMYIHVHPYTKNIMEARSKEKDRKEKGGKDSAGQCVAERRHANKPLQINI